MRGASAQPTHRSRLSATGKLDLEGRAGSGEARLVLELLEGGQGVSCVMKDKDDKAAGAQEGLVGVAKDPVLLRALQHKHAEARSWRTHQENSFEVRRVDGSVDVLEEDAATGRLQEGGSQGTGRARSTRGDDGIGRGMKGDCFGRFALRLGRREGRDGSVVEELAGEDGRRGDPTGGRRRRREQAMLGRVGGPGLGRVMRKGQPGEGSVEGRLLDGVVGVSVDGLRELQTELPVSSELELTRILLRSSEW
jgi:hypothetical protein